MRRALGLAAVAGLLAAAVGWAFWRPDSPAEAAGQDKFAQDRASPAGGAPAVTAIPFDGPRAKKYVQQLCDLGPRVSGSDGMAKQQALVTKHFEAHGATVTRQEFKAKQFSRRDQVGMVNLIASWHPDRPRRVILCTHYDTRPMAHEDDRANWNKPFHSANDGTSGVAFLMELAQHMKTLPTVFGVDFVLFDGEEYIFEPGGVGGIGGDKFFFGSEHFGAEYVKTKLTRKHRYEAAVLFDLFAHAGAKFPTEGYSRTLAPKLTQQLWQVAAAVKAKSFVQEEGDSVRDDHLALNDAGIPAVDVIDFVNYRDHWHKITDTPDKVSAEQMVEVASVVTAWLQWIR